MLPQRAQLRSVAQFTMDCLRSGQLFGSVVFLRSPLGNVLSLEVSFMSEP